MGFALNGTAAAALMLIAATPAAAASFDCTRAATPDEKAICSSPALSDLDTEMATLFGVRMEIPMLMGARGAGRDEQHDWLVARHACGGDTACLTQSYRQRVAELQQTIAEAMQDYCRRLGICG